MFHLGCFGCGEQFGCVGALVVDEECVLETSMYFAFDADRPGDRPGPAFQLPCDGESPLGDVGCDHHFIGLIKVGGVRR